MSDTKAFDVLHSFIASHMRMSHVYQPVMLIELLKNGGCIPSALVGHNPLIA